MLWSIDKIHCNNTIIWLQINIPPRSFFGLWRMEECVWISIIAISYLVKIFSSFQKTALSGRLTCVRVHPNKHINTKITHWRKINAKRKTPFLLHTNCWRMAKMSWQWHFSSTMSKYMKGRYLYMVLVELTVPQAKNSFNTPLCTASFMNNMVSSDSELVRSLLYMRSLNI